MRSLFILAAALSLAACSYTGPGFDQNGPRNALGFLVHGYGPCGPTMSNPCPGVELAGTTDGGGGGQGR